MLLGRLLEKKNKTSNKTSFAIIATNQHGLKKHQIVNFQILQIFQNLNKAEQLAVRAERRGAASRVVDTGGCVMGIHEEMVVIFIKILMRIVIVLMRRFLNVMASRGPIIIIVIMVQWLFGNWRISNGDRFDHLTIWKIVAPSRKRTRHEKSNDHGGDVGCG